MGKIYYMMGKSSSGKDTLYKELKEQCPQMKTMILYTTRPIRQGETDGVEYFFVTKEKLDAFEKEGKLIELRTYHTVMGDWHYATVEDGQVQLDQSDYLNIGTLESYEKIKEFYGEDHITPIYIEVEDGERLKRAIAREETQEYPRYDEVCRRFLADQEDFSEEKLKNAGITRRFYNKEKDRCLGEILKEVRYGEL